VAGGTTLAAGGTTEEATNAALRAGIVSTALAGARPQPTPARPVTREELPAGAAANDVEPAGPRPPRPVTREDLPEGGPANDTHPLLRPVEAAELPAAPVANTNADLVSMTGSGTMVTRSAPFLSPPTTASAGTRTPSIPVTAPPAVRPAPPLPARPKAPPGPPAPRTETAGVFEARGGVVKRIDPVGEPEGRVTAVPRRPQNELSDLGEGPLATAVQETTPGRAGIKPPRERPERGQLRPPIPRGTDAPRAELNRFREPFADPAMRQRQKDILDLAKSDPLEAGNQYGKLVAEDFPGGPEVAEAFTREGRRMDMGTEHEFTIEGRSGRFGSGKLDQLWDDLADKRNVTLTVPRLSPAAADQLERLLAQARQVMGPDRVIVVRETRP
jgi:hypothetical protein